MSSQVARRLFTTGEFHRMGDTGILNAGDRVELVEGEILRMSPIGSRHAACVRRLTALFGRRLGNRASVSVQNPVVLGRHSEVQPDIAILRPRADAYAERHPGPAEILLIVEVVDTSGDYDRGTKLPLYARARVPEVWVVDLPTETIEVHRAPALRAYRDRKQMTRGERVSPLAFSRVFFRVNDILG